MLVLAFPLADRAEDSDTAWSALKSGGHIALIRHALAAQALEEPVVLVTHQVTITALTGHFPASGEVVVARQTEDGHLLVVATVRTRLPSLMH
jgi:hypothetical protein